MLDAIEDRFGDVDVSCVGDYPGGGWLLVGFKDYFSEEELEGELIEKESGLK